MHVEDGVQDVKVQQNYSLKIGDPRETHVKNSYYVSTIKLFLINLSWEILVLD